MIHIFIVNPVAGTGYFADSLRAKLEEIKGLEYYIFSTRYAGYESEVIRRVRDIFEGEQLRYYICGGQATFMKCLNGFDSLDDIEIAYLPSGRNNDFIKAFGSEGARFSDVNELLEGDVLDVDYIKTNHGVCLNSFSVGVDVQATVLMRRFTNYNIVIKKIIRFAIILYATLRSRSYDMDVKYEDVRHQSKFVEFFFGNGFVLDGNLYFDEYAVVDDGRGVLCAIPHENWVKLGAILKALFSRDTATIRENAILTYVNKVKLSNRDGFPMAACLDGEVFTEESDWEVEIVKRGLHLIVPKGVRL